VSNNFITETVTLTLGMDGEPTAVVTVDIEAECEIAVHDGTDRDPMLFDFETWDRIVHFVASVRAEASR